jgi:hypothetical protein
MINVNRLRAVLKRAQVEPTAVADKFIEKRPIRAAFDPSVDLSQAT